MISIQHNDFNMDEVFEKLRRSSCGAMVFFIGTVKSPVGGKEVTQLELQSYEEMAKEQLELIEKEALERFALDDLVVIHRIGKLDVGDKIVLICAVSVGRRAAFEGASYVLEQIKEKVPIFKKEHTKDSIYWQG